MPKRSKKRLFKTDLLPVVSYMTDEQKEYFQEAARRVPGRSLSRFILQAVQVFDQAERGVAVETARRAEKLAEQLVH